MKYFNLVIAATLFLSTTHHSALAKPSQPVESLLIEAERIKKEGKHKTDPTVRKIVKIFLQMAEQLAKDRTLEDTSQLTDDALQEFNDDATGLATATQALQALAEEAASEPTPSVCRCLLNE
jgi:hypothetical protein